MRCDCGTLIAGDDEAPTSSCNGLQRGGERSWSLREVEELMGMVKQAILSASMLSCSQKQLNLGRLFECVKGIYVLEQLHPYYLAL